MPRRVASLSLSSLGAAQTRSLSSDSRLASATSQINRSRSTQSNEVVRTPAAASRPQNLCAVPRLFTHASHSVMAGSESNTKHASTLGPYRGASCGTYSASMPSTYVIGCPETQQQQRQYSSRSPATTATHFVATPPHEQRRVAAGRATSSRLHSMVLGSSPVTPVQEVSAPQWAQSVAARLEALLPRMLEVEYCTAKSTEAAAEHTSQVEQGLLQLQLTVQELRGLVDSLAELKAANVRLIREASSRLRCQRESNLKPNAKSAHKSVDDNVVKKGISLPCRNTDAATVTSHRPAPHPAYQPPKRLLVAASRPLACHAPVPQLFGTRFSSQMCAASAVVTSPSEEEDVDGADNLFDIF